MGDSPYMARKAMPFKPVAHALSAATPAFSEMSGTVDTDSSRRRHASSPLPGQQQFSASLRPTEPAGLNRDKFRDL